MNLKKIIAVACSLCVVLVVVPVMVGCSFFQKNELPSKNAIIKSPDIIEDETLTVGILKNNLPFSFNDDNDFQGIDCDIASAIADELGLKVKFIEIEKLNSDLLNKDKIDIVMGANSSNIDSKAFLSNKYLTTAPVLFSLNQNEHNIKVSHNNKISCQKDSSVSSIVQAVFGESSINFSPDLESSFDDLASKKVDYVAAELCVGQYFAILRDVKAYPVSVIGQISTSSIAVSVNKSNLLSSINKALSSLNNSGIINAIICSWLGSSIDLNSLKSSVQTDTLMHSVNSGLNKTASLIDSSSLSSSSFKTKLGF